MVEERRIICILFVFALILFGLFWVQKKIEYEQALENTPTDNEIISIINDTKHDGEIRKVSSAHYENCRLTWVEKWEWPDEKRCVVDEQSLVKAFSINLRKMDLEDGVSVLKLAGFDSVGIVPKQSLAFGPTPEHEFTSRVLDDASVAATFFEDYDFAVGVYSRFCNMNSRVTYRKGITWYVKKGSYNTLLDLIERVKPICN